MENVSREKKIANRLNIRMSCSGARMQKKVGKKGDDKSSRYRALGGNKTRINTGAFRPAFLILPPHFHSVSAETCPTQVLFNVKTFSSSAPIFAALVYFPYP